MKYYLIAGEASGDLHGSNLMKAILAKDPQAKFRFWGGEKMAKVPIAVAYGDGIGPEIMKATLKIMEAAGAQIDIDTIEIGEKNYLNGFTTGIKPEAWEILNKNKVFLKAPITTPSGGGYKSLNVTILRCEK